jgi:hypothetical protein
MQLVSLSLILNFFLMAVASGAVPVNVILGRPTADSITLNLLSPNDADYYVEYGQLSGQYSSHSAVSKLKKDIPTEIKLSGLNKDTQYYYRVCTRPIGQSAFLAGSENAFHTQRSIDRDFTFTVEADYHRDKPSNPEQIKMTFRNILNEKPDFDIDLGDTFMCEKFATSFSQVKGRYAEDREYFGILGGSVPLYLVMGNHDGEQGYLMDGTENNIAVWAAKARKLYYPNPYPNDFYSGNTTEEPFIGICQNYYSWQWGDALFVVLDAYRYTMKDRKQTKDFWDWTLGETQYKWFKNVLETSKAKYKFVFIHQMLGEVRGGIEWADMYEWGGKNKRGVWEFDKKRSGWDKPIHQLMVANGVTIFFHGHDHFFCKQERDGIIYQEVPQPSARNGSKQKAEQQAHEYEYKSGVIFPSAGHLKVAVSSKQVTVEYVKSSLFQTGQERNGSIIYAYTIGGAK